jgi:hypothetical protein
MELQDQLFRCFVVAVITPICYYFVKEFPILTAFGIASNLIEF